MTSNAWSKEDTELLIAWRVLGLSYRTIEECFCGTHTAKQCKNRMSNVRSRYSEMYLGGGRADKLDQNAKRAHTLQLAEARRKRNPNAQNTHETLCWSCKHSTGKYGFCSWFIYRNWVAIEGWDADQTYLASNTPENRNSYNVRSCPRYEKEERA